MNTLPTILIGRSRGRLTRRLAALETLAAQTHVQPGGALLTRTPRGVFTRGTTTAPGGAATAAPRDLPRWL